MIKMFFINISYLFVAYNPNLGPCLSNPTRQELKLLSFVLILNQAFPLQ